MLRMAYSDFLFDQEKEPAILASIANCCLSSIGRASDL